MINELSIVHLDEVWHLETSAHHWPWPKTVVEKQLQKTHCNFGFWQEDRLAGYAMIQRIAPEAELLNIAVLPELQGHGLGRILLRELIDQLWQEHYQRLFLEVRESNERAIRLYENLGFNQIGERRGYYPALNGREDALLYAKELVG